MALQKTITRKGIELSYHNICNVVINKNNTSCVIRHYANADARAESENNNVFKTSISFPNRDTEGNEVTAPDLDSLKSDGASPHVEVYSILKANAFDDVDLSGATDI